MTNTEWRFCNTISYGDSKVCDKSFYNLEKFTNSEGLELTIPIYRDGNVNLLSMMRDKSSARCIGNGYSHTNRCGFLMDIDHVVDIDQLHAALTFYFVEPTYITINKESGHAQVYWMFTKAIGTHRDDKVMTALGTKYIEYTHKLNSILGLGDIHFTGYNMKNAYNHLQTTKAYLKGEETDCLPNQYSFITLCNLIDITLENAPVWPVGKILKVQSAPSLSTSEMADAALDDDYMEQPATITEIKIEQIDGFTPCTYMPKTTTTSAPAASNKPATTSKTAPINDNSEFRHNKLFLEGIRVKTECWLKHMEWKETTKTITEALITMNKTFEVPLSEKEMSKEVLNQGFWLTMKHSFDYKAYNQSEEHKLSCAKGGKARLGTKNKTHKYDEIFASGASDDEIREILKSKGLSSSAIAKIIKRNNNTYNRAEWTRI